MMTMTLANPTTHEFVANAGILDRAVIRVIWGRGLGSTYQRSVAGRGSSFSMPLTCPECRGSLELHQVDGESPDHLFGTCLCCGASNALTVGAEGRITL
jgi:hypothetical protein